MWNLRRALPLLAVVRDGLSAITIFAAGGAGACRSSGGAPSDANRHAGAGQALVPDENGRVDISTTGTTGIRGRWFASADTEDCSKKGKHAAAECSLLVAPDPKAPVFQPIKDLGMCAVGVAAKVLERADGNPDWDTNLDTFSQHFYRLEFKKIDGNNVMSRAVN